ncbi:MAG: hypothetical protein PHR77_02650 [Kiritimatiellae bacterium]|nr:hypothetical protein [Kiritimatiellia bacterium]MDD5523268.1 hypothetical protein [Kiritimatiellia bacterium]
MRNKYLTNCSQTGFLMLFVLVAVNWLTCSIIVAAGSESGATEAKLWDLAKNEAHRFSTLFTAQNVRDHLSSEEGINTAVDWCKKTAITKVYIETFRDGYQAEQKTLQHAKERFTAEGFRVSGCVTTTRTGKSSTGWKNIISCYTDKATQEKLKAIFEFTAGLFDEIMIDDVWFTDCKCPECDTARKAKTVTIGDKIYSVTGDSWEDYRCELMVRLSRDYVLGAARQVNPRVKIIIKYPQWYDNFHERGYEVLRETADFDWTWVGTETRDYNDKRWGGTVQYEAYFIMRWLGGIGGEKCSGGWYDWLGTTERTYVEQARQTVLAGARESMLFCYGGLQRDTGPKNILALRENIPELFSTAGEVKRRSIIGLAAYKPANSHPEKEGRVFDFIGMMGLPLMPCHEFPENAPAAFFSVHALKDSGLAAKLSAFIAAGKPVLITDGLAEQLKEKVKLDAPNVHVLPVKGVPKSLLMLSANELNAIRTPLLQPLQTSFSAPNRMGLYLFSDGSYVVENFNDEEVKVELNGKPLNIAGRGWIQQWKENK